MDRASRMQVSASMPGRIATSSSSSSSALSPSRSDFVIGKLLGEGAYATVKYAKLKRDLSREFALKIMSKSHILKENKIKYVMLEREILAKLTSPFVVKIALSFMDAQHLYICMEYAAGGSLLQLVDQHTTANMKCGIVDVSLPTSIAQFYVAEIVEALEYIHMAGVIHRDLKPENIVLTSEGHIKLCDFGSALLIDGTLFPSGVSSTAETSAISATSSGSGETSRASGSSYRSSSIDAAESLGSDSSVSSSCDESYLSSSAISRFALEMENVTHQRKSDRCSFVGTGEYVSPEVLRNHHVTAGCDIWALGCVIFKLLTGRSPFLSGSEYLTFQNILSHADGTCPLECPASVVLVPQWDIIDGLLQGVPTERLGMVTVSPSQQRTTTSGLHGLVGPGSHTSASADSHSSHMFDFKCPLTGHRCQSPDPDLMHVDYRALKNHAFFEGVRWGVLLQSEAPWRPPHADNDISLLRKSTDSPKSPISFDEKQTATSSDYLSTFSDVMASGAEREYRLSRRQQKRQQNNVAALTEEEYDRKKDGNSGNQEEADLAMEGLFIDQGKTPIVL